MQRLRHVRLHDHDHVCTTTVSPAPARKHRRVDPVDILHRYLKRSAYLCSVHRTSSALHGCRDAERGAACWQAPTEWPVGYTAPPLYGCADPVVPPASPAWSLQHIHEVALVCLCAALAVPPASPALSLQPSSASCTRALERHACTPNVPEHTATPTPWQSECQCLRHAVPTNQSCQRSQEDTVQYIQIYGSINPDLSYFTASSSHMCTACRVFSARR